MTNRSKGSAYEREIIDSLQAIWPEAHRNWGEQWARGGTDVVGCSGFDIEIKGGKQANIAKTRKWLDQVNAEGKKENFKVVIARPLREERFVLMPFNDWLEMVEIMKAEGIIK